MGMYEDGPDARWPARRSLRRAGGDKKRAVAELGISRTTLYAALRTYDIITTPVSES